MTIDPSQFRALVRGHVQGVSFRYATMEVARGLDLAGFARNLDDGSVEVVAVGPRLALEKLIAFLHQGPSGAHVTEVQVDWDDQSSAPRPFRILH